MGCRGGRLEVWHVVNLSHEGSSTYLRSTESKRSLKEAIRRVR